MTSPIRLLAFVAAACAVRDVDAARILAGIPTASYSHQVFFQTLWRELAARGHQVVVLTSDPTRDHLPNLTEVDTSAAYATMARGIRDVVALNDDKLAAFRRFARLYYDMSEQVLALPQVQRIIRDDAEHFDLVMLEYLYPSFYAFKHRFACPFIGVTSMEGTNVAHETMGNPTHAVLYPSALLSRSGGMGFKERLLAFLLNGLVHFTRSRIDAEIDHLNRNYFGEGYPAVRELADSVDMLFVNANPMFAEVRPLTPATISIAGGMHMKPPRPLPEDLRTFLDASTRGVVYFSMGSNVKSKDLADDTLAVIVETFARIPYDVLWKFEADVLPGKPDNVKIIKWAPQQDVLRHENVKLFVTQAGMQSLEEALFSHVPLIAMPFFGDQDSNAGKVADRALGLRLDYKTLRAEEFRAAIVEVVTNPKYKANVAALARQIRDEPMTPLEKAVWWTEYVLRHGGAQHLKGPRIPAYQYYHLDVLAFLGACLAAATFALYLACRFAYSYAVGLSRRVTIKIKEA